MAKEYIELERLISDLKDLPEQEHIEYMGIYDCIKSQPTANVQEVRHSKWEYEDSDIGWTDYSCNSCGNIITTVAEPNELYEYCPYCGAKMDKE